MSYDPFDGVLLDDPRGPIPGAVAMLLHLRVARRQAKAQGWPRPSLDGLKARAEACRELLAQGLHPGALRDLRAHGLDPGSSRSPHSLASLVAHLEAYLQEVEHAGYLEPDAALWLAADLVGQGRRGFWIERGAEDGPIAAGLRDLVPARLRVLACVPGLSAIFALATRKGGATSGLFGGGQPLVDWFLDGLEQHGHSFPNELQLVEPEGWGSAPWSGALERLFDGPLPLADHAHCFQRGLVDGPVDLLRHAAEQVCAWLDLGIPASGITLVHPQPERAGAFLEPILAEEGVALHVRGALLPLLQSQAWSPLWTLLAGLQRLDPCTVSAGLRASRSDDLRRWADFLAEADQAGTPAFAGSFLHLRDRSRTRAEAVWRDFAALRSAVLPARDWARRLESLAGDLRLPLDPEDFYAPLHLLQETWGGERWDFADLLSALEAFLGSARSGRIPRSSEGIRLISPETVLDDWSGSRATLLLDLSEGAWPAHAVENPDLDWNRRAAINRALLERTLAEPGTGFPPALQRFWLPRAEHGDQVPRAFQREAYAFNKVLALTRERLVALSPAQDEEGRTRAQGLFWHALEGAAAWQPDPAKIHGRLRWRWEGRDPDPRAAARAAAAMARPEADHPSVQAPVFDRLPGIRERWCKGRPAASPTALEGLARCPFRSQAERVWQLQTFDAASRFRMAVGTLAHRILEAALAPFLGAGHWPSAFLASLAGAGQAGAEAVLPHLLALWEAHQEAWLLDLEEDIPREQWPQAVLQVEELLPNLAAALRLDAAAAGPTAPELRLLFPQPPGKDGKPPKTHPLQDGWTRTLLALEQELGPVDLDLGNGRVLTVAGKVDRLERWDHREGLSFLRITDYKTSRKGSLDRYAEGEAPFASHLQVPLYMWVAEVLHPGFPATSALLPLRDEEPEPFTKPLQALAAAGEGGWRDRLRRNLARLDARLQAGDFPPTPGEHCSQCPLGALCGRPVDVTVEAEREDD